MVEPIAGLGHHSRSGDGSTGSLTVTAHFIPDSSRVVITSNSASVDMNYRVAEETHAILSQFGDDEPDVAEALGRIELKVDKPPAR